jgi:hypothetical protein
MKKQVGLRHGETDKRPRDSALQDLDRSAERKKMPHRAETMTREEIEKP